MYKTIILNRKKRGVKPHYILYTKSTISPLFPFKINNTILDGFTLLEFVKRTKKAKGIQSNIVQEKRNTIQEDSRTRLLASIVERE